MAKSPYEILGISEHASPDEVKKAYRKKARENHPDLNPNDPNASERMNQINEAYDRIMNPEKYAKRDRAQQRAGNPGAAGRSEGSCGHGGAYGAGGAYGSGAGGGQRTAQSGPYGWAGDWGWDFEDLFGGVWTDSSPIHPEPSATDSAEIIHAISCINAGHYAQAAGILASIPSTGRTARWHYLSALANHGAGNTGLAFDQIRRAVQMDPGNADYQRAQRSFQQTGTAYRQESEQRGFTVGFIDPGTVCCGLCFVSSMCRPLCLGF